MMVVGEGEAMKKDDKYTKFRLLENSHREPQTHEHTLGTGRKKKGNSVKKCDKIDEEKRKGERKI